MKVFKLNGENRKNSEKTKQSKNAKHVYVTNENEHRVKQRNNFFRCEENTGTRKVKILSVN